MKTFHERLHEIQKGSRGETFITQLKRAGENAVILEDGEKIVIDRGNHLEEIYPNPDNPIDLRDNRDINTIIASSNTFTTAPVVGIVEETGQTVTLGSFTGELIPVAVDVADGPDKTVEAKFDGHTFTIHDDEHSVSVEIDTSTEEAKEAVEELEDIFDSEKEGR